MRAILDLSLREKLVFAPLILLVLWMGIYPMLVPRPDERFGAQPDPGLHSRLRRCTAPAPASVKLARE